MRQISAVEVHAQKVVELGLDPEVFDLTSIEAVAGALRRAAGNLCPCTASTLVRGVVTPMRGLVHDLDAFKMLVEKTLDAMIAHGDILEHRDIECDTGQVAASLLYVAPACFIARHSGVFFIIGVASDRISALPEDIEARIEYEEHLRRIFALQDEDLRSDLIDLGLLEVSFSDWIKAPHSESPLQHLMRVNELLSSAHASHEIPGLSLLDPTQNVRYYRGRWVDPRNQSGRFVARRAQAYGADLWCYVEMHNGLPERFIDLPVVGSRWRGCDEAWHLQMAIDAQRGVPQQFRLRSGPDGTRVMEFFSPVPMWASRRWNAVGSPVSVSGCLFAYRMAEAELMEELRFAHEALWLEDVTGNMKRS